MSEVLIQAENVGKKFCRDLKKSLWYGVNDSVHDLVGAKGDTEELRDGEFWANQDISFELKRGECLGLIGRNGAGKTTLLKMLNGLVKPDAGRIAMRGRVAAMIALGSGFNPVLTGRENIYVNGSILGLSRRYIHDRLESIVDFAEIEDAIDSPVRTYSSGMQVRLGFAIASNLIEPDILLLDEVLAVGDMGFRIKCLNRVREITKNSAVILVSHTMQNIGSFCTRTIVLKGGRVTLDSENVGEAINFYNMLFQGNIHRSFSGNGLASLINVVMEPDGVIQHSPSALAASTSVLTLKIQFEVHDAGPYQMLIGIKSAADEPLMLLPCVRDDGELWEFAKGIHNVTVNLPLGDLVMGEYRTHLVLRDSQRSIALRVDGLTAFRVQANESVYVKVVRFAEAQASSVS